MSPIFAAVILAMSVGYGVYRSCTRYESIRRDALVIDAVGAALMIAMFHWTGAW